MDALVDERAAAFDVPTAFDGARIVLFAAPPLDVSVGLQNLAQTAGGDGALQKNDGVVEAMLADDGEMHALGVGVFDHLARGFEIGGDGLLHLDVLAGVGGEAQGLEANVGKRTQVHHIDFRVGADGLQGIDVTGTVLGGEGLAFVEVLVVAGGDAIANVGIGLRVFVGDGTGANQTDAGCFL